MKTESSPSLRGLRVLVTRPREEAAGLAAAIEAAGGHALLWPALEVQPLPEPWPAREALAALGPGDVVVFVSRNAARLGWPALPAAARSGAVTLVAVGPGSAETLRALGAPTVHWPETRHDSEGMLALPALAPERVRGRRVVIVRGVGGRETLAAGLAARGAEVRYAEVYARRPNPVALAASLVGALPDASVLTSGEALEHWVAEARRGGLEAMLDRALVVVSARLAERAAELGVHGPVRVARAPADDALLDALTDLADAGLENRQQELIS